MTPEATRAVRRITGALAVAWALVALVLSVVGHVGAEHGIEPPIRTSGTGGIAMVSWLDASAERVGVERGDRVLEVDGVPINRWLRERGWEQVAAGKSIHYRIQKPDLQIRSLELLPVRRSSPYQRFFVPLFLASLVAGVTFLAIGVVVWRTKPDRSESWAFLLFCSLTAMQLFASMHSYDSWWGYERMLMNLPFVGAATIHLFSTFPHEPPWLARFPRLRAIPYAVAAVVAVLVLLPGARGTPFAGLLSFASALVGCGIGLSILTREWFRRRDRDDSGRLDIVFLGAWLGFAPVLLAIVLQVFFRVAMPTSVALLWLAVFPLSVAYGIVRNQLFDIRGVARSSAAYGASTLAITGLFALLISSADAAFERFNVNARSPVFSVGFLFFAILVFNPLRDRLQALVDNVFDRQRSGHRAAVREISEAMVSMLSLDEISERLLTAATDTMGVERAMVLILDGDGRLLRAAAWRGEWEEDVLGIELPIDHPLGKHLWMRRQELTRNDFDEATDPESRDACREVFDALQSELMVPILFGVDLLGVIAVGRKSSGERLGADDRQLLRTLANQSAIAIENAKAFDEIAKLNETLEARVEERTAELRETQAQLMQSEKMRSLGQLVAGVAHELNNPIGFVHANLQLLDDYVKKLVAAQRAGSPTTRPKEAIHKLLERSREGTQRVKHIVQDLRTFSRMDQAELGDADINDELRRTLGLMEPRFRDGIRIETDFGELPSVRCFPGQLNQVFMNLVMNAADSIGVKGHIRIQTRAFDGGVRLRFEDDGPGIPEDVRERMFEPFFTTKPVGQGTGLGLSISHGIVERHGGSMWVESEPGAGAAFVIELPLTPQPLDES